MTHGNDNDFDKLTFSQREGKAPLPEPMRLEYIPRRFRQLVWLYMDSEIQRMSYPESATYRITDRDWERLRDNKNIGSIISSYRFEVLGQFHDDIGGYDPQKSRTFFKEMIEGGNYHQTLTLIEFVLRHEYCSEDLRKNLLDVFDEAPTAYCVEEIDRLPTIKPRASREAGEATQRAIQTIRDSSMEGAATHLRKATEQINARDYADSVRESINAVESVARTIDPKASKTLGPALDSLERVGLLKHPALTEAFKKLYGYANDEQGIRHPLLDRDSADVGLDEAVFMFGACASFAAYLVGKYRQTEQQQDSG